MLNIYILRLINNKFYVGRTKNLLPRIQNHFARVGCTWTKKYPPIGVEKIIQNCDNWDEDKYTKMYMSKYGIDNVRGGSFSTLKLKKEEIEMLEKAILTAENKCYKCGDSGHFVRNCPY